MNTDFSHKNFAVVSIGFEKANAEIRGKFSFFSELVLDLCKKIQEKKLGKIFVLSTCNRTEIYGYSPDFISVMKVYCELIGVSFEDFSSYADVYYEKEALLHLFRVSSGLESQILGDFEIISQIKIWYKKFQKYGTTNSYLERAVNTAIQISKRIKNETSLSTGVASVSYAAVHYVLNKISDLQDKKILIIGTGKIGQNTCINLVKHVPSHQITLMNRTESKIKDLAEKFDLTVVPISDITYQVNESDVIIVATSAQEPLIVKKMLTSEKERHFIDLSVPANIDKEINQHTNNHLINVDNLSKVIDETFESRKAEIPKAEEIIQEHLVEFETWLEQRKFVPVIKSLKQNLLSIQENEIKSFSRTIIDVNSDDYLLSQKISQRITNRFAEFINNNPEKASVTIEIFKEMFQLETE